MESIAMPTDRLCDIGQATLRISCRTCAWSEEHSVRELTRLFGHGAHVAAIFAALTLGCGHRPDLITIPEQLPNLPAGKLRTGDDVAIDAVIAEFGGDQRAAIGALLHDLNALAADARSVVSRGYVRGLDLYELSRRRRERDGW